MGPMTGRAAGYCAGNDRPGFAHDTGWGRGPRRAWARPGMGMRRGYGGGFQSGFRPRGRWMRPEWSPEDEAAMLKERAEYLEEELKNMRERIADLDTGSEPKQ
jgi:hypothetical protein